jgi:SAM-dependent methyltransferase
MAASMNAFGAFEHHGWQNVATGYDGLFGELTTQCIAPMLDAVGARPGNSLLDVATGPGYLAAAAAARGAAVTGIDFSSTMVSQARARHPGLSFREGDAEALPFPNGSFDAVTIGFGLLHFPDPDKALAEAHRVLRTGGRIAFTVWAAADKAVGFGLIAQAVQAHGRLDVGLPEGPPFFRFSDPEECRRTLTALGFVQTESIEVPQTWRFPSAHAWIEGVARSTVRTAALLRAQTEGAIAEIRAAMVSATKPYTTTDGGIELPMAAVLTCARKP